MIYPNLSWALDNKRMTLDDLRGVVPVSLGHISRKLNGYVELAPHERMRIAELLGFDVEWLFAPARPVPLKRREDERSAQCVCGSM